MKTIIIAFALLTLSVNHLFAGIENGIVMYLPFNGNSQDMSDNGNNGKVNGATLIQDRFEKENSAYRFDGENDYIECPIIDFESKSASFSVWIKSSTKEPGRIIETGPCDFQVNGFLMAINNTSVGENKISFGIGGSQLNDNIAIFTDFSNDGQWHHVVGIYNTLEDIVEIYIDSIKANISKYSGSCGIQNINYIDISLCNENINSEFPISIGRYQGKSCGGHENGSEYFKGEIDDLRIYDRPITEVEIKTLYEIQPNFIAVTPTSQVVSSTKGITSFKVTTDIIWYASSSDYWLTVVKNANTVSVSYDDNTSESRIGKIIIQADNSSNQSQTVEIIQEAGNISCNYTDSDMDGVINIIDKCDNTLENSFVDKNGCPINLSTYYTHDQLEEAIAEALTEKNQIIIQKDKTITDLNSKLNTMFTEEQLNNAIVKAIMEKQDKIDDLETQISLMFSQNQLDEAILDAKKGLYNQEQVEVIINKILEWDTNNDGVIGLIEAIHVLQMTTGVKPLN